MAYKLLVADDEYWAREKLRHILNWSQLDMEFLEPACDGQEVLQRLQSEQPDVLLTDINMPGLNGVELLEQLAAEHSDMVMLVVSGYDTFDYVKKSMRSGAINYLLKPVSKQDMTAAMSEVLELLHQRKSNRQTQQEQQAQMERAASLLQDRELSLLLETPAGAMEPAAISAAGEGEYYVTLLKVHNLSHAIGQFHNDINELFYEIKQRLRQLLDGSEAVIFNNLFHSNEFLLLTHSAHHGTMETARRFIDGMESLFHAPITVVFSQQPWALSDIRKGYEDVVSRLWQRRFSPCHAVLLPQQPQMSECGGLVWNKEMEKQLSSFVANGNRDMLARLLLDKTGLRQADRTAHSCRSVMRLLKCIHHELLLQCGPAADGLACSNLAAEASRSVELLELEPLCNLELELIDAILAGHTAEDTASMKAVVQHVRKNIDEHYYEPLTLSSLAQKYIVESSYLSRCFKQETGESLTTYLTNRRIQKATEHIQENNVGLTEIAFLVGYDDYTYFSRVFRKVVGVSPRDYRNRILEGEEIAP